MNYRKKKKDVKTGMKPIPKTSILLRDETCISIHSHILKTLHQANIIININVMNEEAKCFTAQSILNIQEETIYAIIISFH